MGGSLHCNPVQTFGTFRLNSRQTRKHFWVVPCRAWWCSSRVPSLPEMRRGSWHRGVAGILCCRDAANAARPRSLTHPFPPRHPEPPSSDHCGWLGSLELDSSCVNAGTAALEYQTERTTDTFFPFLRLRAATRPTSNAWCRHQHQHPLRHQHQHQHRVALPALSLRTRFGPAHPPGRIYMFAWQGDGNGASARMLTPARGAHTPPQDALLVHCTYGCCRDAAGLWQLAAPGPGVCGALVPSAPLRQLTISNTACLSWPRLNVTPVRF